MVCSRVVFGVFFLLNLVLWTQGSSAAIPFSTLIALLALWFGISVPLTFVGAYFGYKKRVSFMSPEPNFFICMLFGITIEKFLCLCYWSLSEMGFILSLFDNLDHKKWKFHFLVKNMLIEFERYSKISCSKKFHPTIHLLHRFIFSANWTPCSNKSNSPSNSWPIVLHPSPPRNSDGWSLTIWLHLHPTLLHSQ